MKEHSLVNVAAVGNSIRVICSFKKKKKLNPHKTVDKLNHFQAIFLKFLKLNAQKLPHF